MSANFRYESILLQERMDSQLPGAHVYIVKQFPLRCKSRVLVVWFLMSSQILYVYVLWECPWNPGTVAFLFVAILNRT